MFRPGTSANYTILDSAVPQQYDPVYGIVNKYNVPYLYVPSFNPHFKTISGLDRIYQTGPNVNFMTPPTPQIPRVTTPGEEIGLVLDPRSDVELISYDDFTNTLGTWQPGSGISSLTIVDGQMRLQAGGTITTMADRCAWKPLTVVAGALYRVRATIIRGTDTKHVQIRTEENGLGTAIITISVQTQGDNTRFVEFFFIPSITTVYIHVLTPVSPGAAFFTDDVIVERIHGTYISQTAAAIRGTYQKPLGHVWEGDSNVSLSFSNLLPDTSGTIIASFVARNTGSVPVGGGDSPTRRCYVGVNNSGQVGGGIGNQDFGVITAGVNVIDVPGVAAVRWNGSTVQQFWQPFGGSFAQHYTGNQNGSPVGTTAPFAVGSYANIGTTRLDGEVYRALVVSTPLTNLEIEQISRIFASEPVIP